MNNPPGLMYGIVFLISLFIIQGCSQEESAFPSRPITIIVPWDAGGGTDGVARAIANEARSVFGVPVNVVNRPGGSGATGHIAGMKARLDGYTVTMITYELCSYIPLGRAQIGDTDFKAIIQVNEDPAAITVHANSPWKTLKEFLDYSRDHPKELTVGNSGPGAVWHLGMIKLERSTGTQFTHIPHAGAKPATVQLEGEHISAVAVSPAEVLQFVQQGSMRCLGIMSEERFSELPEVPTCREQGIDLIHGTWRGLAIPKDTPDEIVAVLEKGFKQAYDSPAFKDAVKKALWGLKYRNSTDFTAFLRSESESMAELIESLNLSSANK